MAKTTDPDDKLQAFLVKLTAGGTVKITLAQRPLFLLAVDRGFAETASNPKPPKKPPATPPTFGRVSVEGERWLLERQSPRDAILGLQRMIEARMTAYATPPSEDHTTRIDELAAELERLRAAVREAAESRRQDYRRLAEALALARDFTQKAADDMQRAFRGASPGSAPLPSPHHEDETVRFVERWWKERGQSCSVVDLKAHLDDLGPPLSIGAFHDLLRSLHRRGAVSLSNWGRTLSEIPQPELALFLADKVMYYVNPRDRSV